jgi:hypothetical protein
MTSTELLSLLASNPDLDGSTASELAATIGCTTADIRPALRALVRDGELVTSGPTRGTRYSLAATPDVGVVARYVHDVLRHSPGLRIEEIRRITCTTALETRAAVNQLITAGIVRSAGNTRGTRYTAVSL